MLIHFNTYFIILATCFGYVISIIRPTRTVELALDAALFRYEALQFMRYQNLSAVYTNTGHHGTTQHITIYNVISIRFYSVLQFIRYQCFITAFK
jgi:hypothetical protein